MKKRLFISILLIVIMLLIVMVYTINREPIIEDEQYASSKIIMGEIIEVIDTNEIKIEITKERGGYRKGDIVIVNYEKISIELLNEETKQSVNNVEENEDVNVGDIISAKIDSNTKDKDGYDYYDVSEIVKMVY